MTTHTIRREADAVYQYDLPAGEGWMHDLKPGQYFRIVDVEGNQAADTLFYPTNQPDDRYSAIQTIASQENVYLSTGSVLKSEVGRSLLEIVDDTVGRHDTLGGACSAQSNTVRYDHDRLDMHNCRDTFMYELSKRGDYTKRDLAPNINFFMNVPVSPEGGLAFADGLSGPGKYVEMKALEEVTVLISNCPQLNNPCSGYNPTVLRLLVWDA
ncbi:urea amidolyase associated protein UAAP2 [Alkalicoccus luteus]|uniref:DUF1989 domain-containing protein n=1 Tax=Alkalicoccus luteus TaxID=1237094 RepID=A0A969PNH0_9BACI|nr:urea amidolyase associated protein UAAP2 [Alkalicoccus luteus]NJP36044.1 DUF1989 domain-containing protein [Alkalicoccus luteus]